jgi:hypothetical protein
MSPITPPPSAISVVLRSARSVRSASKMRFSDSHHRPLLQQMRHDQVSLAQQAGTDMDGIGAVAEVDGEGLHGKTVVKHDG